jgi:CheY-like chemotaxis protein
MTTEWELLVTDPIRVLHVDDDPDFLGLAETTLAAEHGFDVATETDPAAALERFEDESFDAVVSDYEMPRMDGLELLAAVRERDSAVPFVLFTGKGSEAVASDAISAGVTDYLQKSRGLEQFELLSNRIVNAVDHSRTVEQLGRETHRLDRILTATPMAIVVHDLDGTVSCWNDRAEEILDAPASELDATAYPDVSWTLREPDGTVVPADRLPYRRVIETGDSLRDVEYVGEAGDGSELHIVVHGAPLLDEDGAVDGAVIVFDRV